MAYNVQPEVIFMSFLHPFKVYFIGICGISMSALALYLTGKNVKVCGSDSCGGEIAEMLKRGGVDVRIGDGVDENLIDSELVVYSSAVPEADERLLYARQNRKAVLSRAELLAEICDCYPFSVGVGGTHGKTTVTAMLAHILKCAEMPFDAHIGGLDVDFGNIYTGGGERFITEVCEYKRNIKYFAPAVGVVLNVAPDHLESYGGFSALAQEFIGFAKRSGVAVINGDDEVLKNLNGIKFSLKNKKCEYYACKIKPRANGFNFTVYERGKKLGRFWVKGIFSHNVLNALAALAAGRACGADKKSVARGLKCFRGVKRREEWLGETNGAKVFADYCHHPEQIEKTLKALKERAKGRLITLFQPHTYSRTASLFEQFVAALSNVSDRTFITAVYAAREEYSEAGSGRRLCSAVAGAEYIADLKSEIGKVFSCAKKGDVIAVLGAGDVYFYAEDYLRNRLT